MTTIDLSKKTIMITGALGAIAEQVVIKLAETGASLMLTDLKSEDEAVAVLTRWGLTAKQYVYLHSDVTDSASVATSVEKAFQRFPSMDMVIGHAGGCVLHPFKSCTEEYYEDNLRFNFLSQTYLARAVLKHWTEKKIQGHMMFTSSYVARAPHVGIPSYAPAKAALENFTKCLALEYAGQGIRFNCVSPGNVAAGASLAIYETDDDYRAFVQRVSPMGKRNSPDAIGNAYVFLCSSLAEEVNGQILSVDWGISIPKIG